MPIGSVIAAIALAGSQDCAVVFDRAALDSLGTKTILNREQNDPHWRSHLLRFGTAACKTQNPDIIWQLAFVESGFRFVLTRTNHRTHPIVAEGASAIETASRLGMFRDDVRMRDRLNIDLGVLQVNWRYHAAAIKHPLMALSPEGAVDIVSATIIKEKLAQCGDRRWLGCYHNAEAIKMAHYERLVAHSRLRLMTALNKGFPNVVAKILIKPSYIR